jgi:hypothetical protein
MPTAHEWEVRRVTSRELKKTLVDLEQDGFEIFTILPETVTRHEPDALVTRQSPGYAVVARRQRQ